MKRMEWNSRYGFTMMEIVTVLAIFAILVVLLLGVLMRAKENAKTLQCASNLRQIGLAINSFSAEHNLKMPHSVDESGFVQWLPEISRYVSSAKVFLCPLNTDPVIMTYLPSGAPTSGAATFSHDTYDIATITVTKLGTACGQTLTVPFGSGGNADQHEFHLTFSIPSKGYTFTICGVGASYTTALTWPTGAAGEFVSPGFTNLRLSDIVFMAEDTAWGYNVPPHTNLAWSVNLYNPYTRIQSGFYLFWGVKEDDANMIYTVCAGKLAGGDEAWLYPAEPVYGLPPAFDAVPDADQFIRNKAAGLSDLNNFPSASKPTGQNDNGRWYDVGFRVHIDVTTSAGATVTLVSPLVEAMGNQKMVSSYGYNANWNGVGGGVAPGNRVAVLDYKGFVCDPKSTSDISKISPRHISKRINVLRVDGSVESVTLDSLLIDGTTFSPSQWSP